MTAGSFEIPVRAGERYLLEVHLGTPGAIVVPDDLTVSAVPASDYDRFAAALLRLRKALDALVALKVSRLESSNTFAECRTRSPSTRCPSIL